MLRRPNQRADTDDDDARDLALVERIRAGDPDAWGELLSSYQDRLYSICVRMVHDRELARDLTQDAMVKIIQGLEGFDARAKLSTWMIRITMNVCLSKLRSEKLRRHASLEQLRAGGDFPDRERMIAVGREPDPTRGVSQEEGRDMLARALQEISDEHRAILVLRDMRGLDYDQIAQVLGIAVGTVKSRLFRARSALRDELERLEGARRTDCDEG